MTNRTKLLEEITHMVIEGVPNVNRQHVTDLYLTSYLPFIAECLGSIADSLEKIANEDNENG